MENILTMRWSNDFIRHLPYNETWGDSTSPAVPIITETPTTTQDPEVVPAPPPVIEAGSPADPSRSGARLTPDWKTPPYYFHKSLR